MVVTIACAQVAGIWEDPEATLAMARNCTRMAADAGASLICFPEQFATGWSPQSTQFAENLTGTIVTGLRKLARDYGIYTLGSFVEQNDPKPRNTCVVTNPQGDVIATYAKIHLFSPMGEDKFYSPGSNTTVFAVEDYHFGLAICYDLRFPALFEAYAREGVHGVIVPAAWPCRRIENWEVFIRARAMENQLYIIGVNTTGTTPIECYCGCSMTADPTGTIISRGRNGEELLLTELSKEFLFRIRREFPVLRDQRPDVYRQLTADGGRRE